MMKYETASKAVPIGNVKATREDWLKLALETLTSDGVESVRVLSLGQKLEVSRSSFYWYFKSRQDLLNQLLEHWRNTNTKAIVERASRPADNITRAVINIFECWVDEALFDPLLDFAIRAWARKSGPVRRILDQADEERVNAIRDMFQRHGYEAIDAYVRARILYFMQIGYYSLELHEPMKIRLSYVAAYLRSFTGQEPSPDDVAHFSDYVERAAKASERTKVKARR